MQRKGFVKCTTILLFLIIPCAAQGEELQEPSRLRTEPLHLLPLIPAFLFLELTLHESSHAFAAATCGAKEIRIYPYPETRNNKRTMGRSSFYLPETASSEERIWIHLSPSIFQILTFTSADIILSLSPSLRRTLLGTAIYIAGMIAPFLDFVYNLYNITDPTSDVRRSVDLMGNGGPTPYIFTYLVGTIIVSVALWRVVRTGKRIFSRNRIRHQS